MTGVDRYPKQIFWSDEDGGFIAIAPDLPGCSAFGETEEEAISELNDAIVVWIDASKIAGNAIPAPSRPAEKRQFSGKVLVRMPRELHKDLVAAAETEDVSLNQYIVFLLTKNLALLFHPMGTATYNSGEVVSTLPPTGNVVRGLTTSFLGGTFYAGSPISPLASFGPITFSDIHDLSGFKSSGH